MPQSIDEYIRNYPEVAQKVLQKIRRIIKRAAPLATEAMKYGIPTFVLNGNLIHFAAFKNHIGFYPTPSGVAAFKKEISRYKWSKGSIRFPLDLPIPYVLIKRIVEFRVKENSKLPSTKK